MPKRRGNVYVQVKSDKYRYVRSTKSGKILAAMNPAGEFMWGKKQFYDMMKTHKVKRRHKREFRREYSYAPGIIADGSSLSPSEMGVE